MPRDPHDTRELPRTDAEPPPDTDPKTGPDTGTAEPTDDEDGPKRRTLTPALIGVVLVGVVVLAVLGYLAVAGTPGGDDTAQQPVVPGAAVPDERFEPGVAPPQPGNAGAEITVRYEVTGIGGRAGLISYNAGNAAFTQALDQELPFSIDVPLAEQRTIPLSLVAQGAPGTTDISCRILVNGQEIAANTAPGDASTATCGELMSRPPA